jgi:hypothetical protein
MVTFIIKQPKKFNKLEENDLKAFEKKLGSTIPDEYRNFLLEYNGGYPKPNYFDIPKPEDNEFLDYPDDMGSTIEYLCGIYKDPSLEGINLIKQYEKYQITEKRMPDEILPIGGDLWGSLICVGLKGDYRNKIFYWDSNFEPDVEENKQPFWQNITVIAASFNEFLQSLHEEPIN